MMTDVNALSLCYQRACLAELEAIKPGNVHVFADGHGMTVQQFVASAEASATVLCDDAHYGPRTVGARIWQAAQATHQAVACNTNLGILLLAGPVIHAQCVYPDQPLSRGIAQVLHQTTIADADAVYAAIRLMQPAGLGQRREHDVAQTPNITLLQAMQFASPADMVARQYAEGYQHAFKEALPLYQAFCARWDRPAWATTAVYLHWLSQFADSHVTRKYGTQVAAKLQAEAVQHYAAFSALDNPKTYLPTLLAWDTALKQQAINPGTSADLTVLTLLLAHMPASHH